MSEVRLVAVDSIRFVKELYPRLKQDDAAIERYRSSIDRLPPIVVARDGVLVDGFHRWQAHKAEGSADIAAENLGNLSDIEILKESVRRNASHGRQLEKGDKKRMADQLWRAGTRDEDELVQLLSVTKSTLETYLRDAKRDEKEAQKEKAWELWLDCYSESKISEIINVPQQTLNGWITEKRKHPDFGRPPESRQHFDIWQFHDGGDGSYFGRMPPQVVENLLWFFTEPGDIVFDPFVGSGTTIEVAKAMGRRVWASDRKPNTPMLPIHTHDITAGWPTNAPKKAKFILLDPPYWQQAKGRYSESLEDLGNVSLEEFYQKWAEVIKICVSHVDVGGKLAYIISPTNMQDGSVVDHATDMMRACWDVGLKIERRIIVPYQTQQATGQQVTWARDNKRMLKLYRDLVIWNL